MDGGARDLLFLSRIPGLGPARLRALVERFHTPASVLRAGVEQLRAVRGVHPGLASAIVHAATGAGGDRLRRWADDQLRLMSQTDARLVTIWHSEYPASLRAINDPPVFLFVRGSFRPADDRAIAVVGTRAMTAYGGHMAEQIAGGLSRLGFTVISGLARGIDTVAHTAALAAGGRTIAVIGSGIDRVYPPENVPLAERVARSGAVVTECVMGERPLPFRFPRRNRIISGLAVATIVVESGPAGGAMITAALAQEQGRVVLAVPSKADLQRESGTNLLIKSGRAQLMDTLGDLVREFSGHPGTPPNPRTPPEGDPASGRRPRA